MVNIFFPCGKNLGSTNEFLLRNFYHKIHCFWMPRMDKSSVRQSGACFLQNILQKSKTYFIIHFFVKLLSGNSNKPRKKGHPAYQVLGDLTVIQQSVCDLKVTFFVCQGIYTLIAENFENFKKIYFFVLPSFYPQMGLCRNTNQFQF